MAARLPVYHAVTRARAAVTSLEDSPGRKFPCVLLLAPAFQHIQHSA